MMLHLGDTRHFSMINLVLNDFNPILIKDFAGHEDINNSYHYFKHMDKMVRCMTYSKFQELKRFTIDNDMLSFNNPINLEKIARDIKKVDNKKYKEIDYGKCYSEKFYYGDISDCKPVFGECYNCYFSKISENKHREEIEQRRKILEERLREEGILLGKFLKSLNQNYDSFVEFQRGILRIQQASNEYFNISSKLE